MAPGALRGDQFYDRTATAWDARSLTPKAHRDDCFFAPWSTVAAYCSCTNGRPYPRRRRQVAP
jgi:hypothetical protein